MIILYSVNNCSDADIFSDSASQEHGGDGQQHII